MSSIDWDLEADGEEVKRRVKIGSNSTAKVYDEISTKEEESKTKFKHQSKQSLIEKLRDLSLKEKTEVLPIIILALFLYFYLKSLEGCPHRPVKIAVCLKCLKEFGASLAVNAILSAICYLTLLALIYFRIVNTLWIIPTILALIGVCWCQNGVAFVNHGFFNQLIVCAIIFSIVGVFFLIKAIIGICRKGRKYVLIMLILVILSFALFYIKYIRSSCDNWTKGLKGKELMNVPGECKFHMPNYCEMEIRCGVFNLNKLTKECKDYKMKVEISWLPEKVRNRPNLKRIGYPRIENHSYKARVNQTELARIVNEGIIDMDDPSISQNIKDNIEITVDLQDNEFNKIEIVVKRNDTRVEEIKKIRKQVMEKDQENNKQRINKDVLILYLDNVSRTHFHRKMKNLTNWLTEATEESNSNYHVYEYFRYHSKAHCTNPNLISMFYGEQGELFNESSNVFKTYSDNGYISGMFLDLCEAESVEFGNTYNSEQQFYHFDHFAGNIACDFNHDSITESFAAKDLEIVLSKGRNAPFRRSLYSKALHEIEFEYVKQFWDKYNDTRKIFRTFYMLNHETTGDLIGYADNDFVELLTYFHNKGYLQQTIVMFVADHGPHFIIDRIPVIPDDSRLQENFFPLLMILVLRDIPSKNLKFLDNNQQLFVTPHEIYGLLKSIAVGEKDGSSTIKDYSIMHEDLPKGRGCHLNNGGIKFDQCWCSLDEKFIQKQVSKRGYIYMEF